LEEHEREIEELERKLEEYRGLISERQIRIEESYLYLLKRLRLVALEAGPHPSARRPILPGYVEDWDFSNAYWTLDTGIYVSPPSSLKIWNGCLVLCKATGTLNITDGRIVSYIKCGGDWGDSGVDFRIVFRNGSSPGSATGTNTYLLSFDGKYSRIILRRVVNGSTSDIVTKYPYSDVKDAVMLSSWNKWRCTWWTDPTSLSLIVRVEVMINEMWTKICDDLIDSANYFSTPDTRRCGFHRHWYTSVATWYDDTEIWSA